MSQNPKNSSPPSPSHGPLERAAQTATEAYAQAAEARRQGKLTTPRFVTERLAAFKPVGEEEKDQ